MKHELSQSLKPNRTLDDKNQEYPEVGLLSSYRFFPSDVFAQVPLIAEKVNKLIMQGDVQKAKNLITLMDHWYQIGTLEIKNLITLEFVLPVTTCMEVHQCAIKNIFPPHLLKEYYQQINTIGI